MSEVSDAVLGPAAVAECVATSPNAARDESPTPDDARSRRRRHLAAAVVLAAATVAIYAQTRHFEHVPLDDYVTGNPRVLGGLTVDNVVWAWTTSEIAALYQPLVWMSYQAEATLFGDDPGAMHLTNAAIHFLNAVLLYALLVRTTGRLGASLVVAALFVAHPLKVESVAWVTERKDLLSAFFGLLALHAYVARVRTGRRRWTLAGLACFAASLLSKQMLVTLPCVLLLVDAWPLRRVGPEPGSRLPLGSARTWLRLVREKLPWFAVSAGFCVAAVVAQRGGGAVVSFETLPPAIRLANAVLSYALYVGMTLWPTRLAVPYPHPGRDLPWMQVGIAAAVVAAITAGAVLVLRRRPVAGIGWFWFLGTLVPVIGLVQVGSQQLADRFTYFPQIGLFVAVVFLLDELVPASRTRRVAVPVATCAAFVALVVASRTQAAYWKDGATLYGRSLAITKDNVIAMNNYGTVLMQRRNYAAARTVFEQILALDPRDSSALTNLGGCLIGLGERKQGTALLRQALEAEPPKDVSAIPGLTMLGTSLTVDGEFAAAVACFEVALRIDPHHRDSLLGFARTQARVKRFAEAERALRSLLERHPADGEARQTLAQVLQDQGRADEGLEELRAWRASAPQDARPSYAMGTLLLSAGRIDEAVAAFEETLRIDPRFLPALINLGGALSGQGRHAAAADRFRAVLAVDSGVWNAHYGLARSLRAQGDRAGARTHYEQAVWVRPDIAVLRLECAELLLDLGDRPAARVHLEVARRLEPNLPGLAEQWARLGEG